jgi:hypothetical protein
MREASIMSGKSIVAAVMVGLFSLLPIFSVTA